jgi:hypothetical protein
MDSQTVENPKQEKFVQSSEGQGYGIAHRRPSK